MDTKEVKNEIHIRPSRLGDAGYVAYMHGKYYAEEYGFGGTAEYYFMKTLTDFVWDPEGGRLWVAEADGKIVGAVGIVKAGANTAQLRWFILEPEYQGRGIGKRLLETALLFARQQKFKRIFLWTFKGLDAARSLYDRAGFALTEEKANNEWCSREITEQKMELDL